MMCAPCVKNPADAGVFLGGPSRAYTCGCRSCCELVTVSKLKLNGVRVTGRGKAAWSVNREPLNKNRFEGFAKQGEQAHYCKGLVTQARWRPCSGCAMKVAGTSGPLEAALTRLNLQAAWS